MRNLAIIAAATAGLMVISAGRGEAIGSEASRDASDVSLTGRPTRITDGDTFRLGDTRVRLHGVDAPEMNTVAGRRARSELTAIIGRSPVRCADTGQRSYNRVVATCHAADGRELGAAMVRAGWASDAPRFSRGRYAALEREARVAGRGMHAT